MSAIASEDLSQREPRAAGPGVSRNHTERARQHLSEKSKQQDVLKALARGTMRARRSGPSRSNGRVRGPRA